MLPDLLRAALRVGLQVRLPQADYLPATSPNVGVLAVVEGDSAPDARLRAGAFAVMPVVTVELHHETRIRDSGIRGELSAEGELSLVGNTQRVEQGVARRLNL